MGEPDIVSKVRTGLLEYQVKCSQNSWIHSADSEIAYNSNNIFTVAGMILTGLSATESIVVSNMSDRESNIYSILTISNSIILYVITALSGIRQYLNYERDAELHKTASTRFLNMSNNIKKFLVLDADDKDEIVEYYKWVSSEFENIVGSTPGTSVASLKNFEKTFGIQVKNNDVFDTKLDEVLVVDDKEPVSCTERKQNAIKYEIDRFLVNSYN
jgi:hypothetical protein